MNDNDLKENFVFIKYTQMYHKSSPAFGLFLNRQFKHFLKFISNYIRMHHIDFILTTRANFALIISLIHNNPIPRLTTSVPYLTIHPPSNH
jgi:hypothetical protein